MSSSAMALRTRLFGAILRRTATPVEQARDFPALRAERLRVQGTRLGTMIFGRTDPAASVEQITVGTGLRALVHRPKDAIGPLPCVVNFHGGGWVQGNPEQSAWLASRVAVRNRVAVISPAYRLAPEHPFPAGLDDCHDALAWIVEHADELGITPERVAVMGDSAGGNIAAVLALLARDEGGPQLRAQVLIYPSVEMYERWPSEDRHAEAPVLTSANMRGYARLYLGEQYGTEDFRASPIRAASHAGLPKTLIVTAAADPLLDNGARYRDALAADGVPVRYVEHDGAIHGFMSLPGVVPVAREALDDIVEFLGEAL
ncbi:alpha/beta hydrolase [Aeromicrobium wangtongii]|uniref:Alpha/beta hydrolase n=1 Tax=Aeromicrobium wangtongii TaxID=2969247 RepID=A0ABY5MCI8_9ACTN|nr:alpha/beta hydrolase [Aeromicrobium wangtongii]MCD9197142.1 alpha/beta hydrolase [Aeromicrobium wangtongii]UUP14639.1 alpha/beta hydrolase [Aeromicrobium wangtongii]